MDYANPSFPFTPTKPLSVPQIWSWVFGRRVGEPGPSPLTERSGARRITHDSLDGGVELGR